MSLNLLKEYFDGQRKYSIRGLYDNLFFLLGENCLTGEYWSDEVKGGMFNYRLTEKEQILLII